MSARHIVYVHGICHHEAGFSDPWFASLKPFAPSLSPGDLDGNRHEVVWSDIVNPTAFGLAAPLSAAQRLTTALQQDLKQQRMKRQLLKALEDRMGGALLRSMHHSASPTAAMAAMERVGLPSIPGVNCIDDFVKYLTDSEIRSAVLARFELVVKPLLDAGHTVEVIAHSWGTVVAYEGLRALEADHSGTGKVHNFFTVGSALSIGIIRNQLLPNALDGKRPQSVERWVNLDARGDIVGGSLIDEDYQVSPEHEFLDLQPAGCATFAGFFISPSCAHASYFRVANETVNNGIFGNFIETS